MKAGQGLAGRVGRRAAIAASLAPLAAWAEDGIGLLPDRPGWDAEPQDPAPGRERALTLRVYNRGRARAVVCLTIGRLAAGVAANFTRGPVRFDDVLGDLFPGRARTWLARGRRAWLTLNEDGTVYELGYLLAAFEGGREDGCATLTVTGEDLAPTETIALLESFDWDAARARLPR